MFLIEIDGVKILYTGDYSREEDRHLKPAEIPESCDVDVLIVESTYGVEKHENREFLLQMPHSSMIFLQCVDDHFQFFLNISPFCLHLRPGR